MDMDMNFNFAPVYPHHDLLVEIGEVEMAMEGTVWHSGIMSSGEVGNKQGLATKWVGREWVFRKSLLESLFD